MKNCPFCNTGLINDQRVVLSNETCLFLQTPQEILFGSGLIVPKKHRETLFDLSEDEWRDTYKLLSSVKELLDQQCQPQGYNVGWNCGEVGGQHIFHAHLHVIPRYANEPFAGKGIRHWLKSEANRRL
ncbi:HIT family protein [Brevibacillus sp. SYSU BS000544]|uniref:HIT family protein n=1 Tax=Brevibacillus sp. SYSU BS000544 TaxID=3416443 RepID=UPI003CE59E99